MSNPYNQLSPEFSAKSIIIFGFMIFTEDCVFNRLKISGILLLYSCKSFCHYSRRITKCAAAKCAKYKNFCFICRRCLKYTFQSFHMEFVQAAVSNIRSCFASMRIHTITRPFPKIRSCTGQHIHLIPLLFFHSFRT